MESSTKRVIKKIAEIQVEALQRVYSNKDTIFPEKLCSLLGLQKDQLSDEASDVIENLLIIYHDLQTMPELIMLLNEYQLGLCSHILFVMEDEWVIEDPEGVFGTWNVLHKAFTKFHPEWSLIIKE